MELGSVESAQHHPTRGVEQCEANEQREQASWVEPARGLLRVHAAGKGSHARVDQLRNPKDADDVDHKAKGA
uniref:Uncharacterized protein n=1 Tax=Tetraselmis sp. GSL018 TaxID=582737 RepID=A0A061RV37_9CHLO